MEFLFCLPAFGQSGKRYGGNDVIYQCKAANIKDGISLGCSSECANSVGFGTFSRISELLVQCAKISLGILFEICEKRPFQKCLGQGGCVVTFLSTEQPMGRCSQNVHRTVWTTHCSESESLSLLPLSTRAGTPFGQTSPCL